MDRFDIQEARKAPRQRRSFDLVWNILAIVMLVLSLCVGVVVLQVFLNPYSAWNPFPPPTLIPLPPTYTPTVTLRMTLEPSWTPTVAIPTQTSTPRPTNTPLVTDTPSALFVSSTPTVEATPVSGDFSFEILEGDPKFIDGASFRPELGCDWIGVAGQALGFNDEPIRYQIVHLGGTLEGATVDSLVATGMNPAYGPAGYEFIIANRLVATTDTLWIQLEDVQGLPLSDRIYFDTYADCDHNLVIINLKQVR